MTDRRTFLRGLAAVSAAAVPVVVQAAALGDWDRVEAGLTILHPDSPKAIARAKAAGMKPDDLFTIIPKVKGHKQEPGRWPALLFETEDGSFRTFRPRGEDRR